MKKIILTAVLSFTISNTFAQDIKSKKGENYLPEAGDWAIGFNADGVFRYLGNAFNGKVDNTEPNVSFTESGAFVGKYFITDKKAYRVIANIGYNSLTQSQPDINDNEIIEIEQSVLGLTLGLGKEWRRGKTRLQGFYGADILVSANSGKLVLTERTIDTGELIGKTELKSGVGFGAGIQGFIGAEYFIFPKFSLGAQYTYRIGFEIGGKQTYTTQDQNEPAETIKFETGSNYNIGNLGITSINLTLHF